MSFNFSPQPRSFLPSFPSSPLTPVIPSITNPALRNNLNFLTQNYWEGSVRINAGNGLVGDSPGGNFTNFVCSFWGANLLPIDQLVLQHFVPCIIAPVGSFQFSQDPFPNPTFTFGQFCIMLSWDGTPLLTILNANSTSISRIYAGPSSVMGVDSSFNPILPIGVWHHFIISYSPTLPKAQLIVDRVRIVESTLGPTRGAFNNSINTDWQTLAGTNASIDLAYFYFGVSDTFFDLTVPGNLDYFISSSLTPVNLGPAGVYVTPLTCLVMHTGNPTNLFRSLVEGIDPWDPNLYYAQGAVVSYNGKNYFSILAGNRNNQPDISPNDWWIYTQTTTYQFPYNAATGRLWGGTISTAPTAPPTGV